MVLNIMVGVVLSSVYTISHVLWNIILMFRAWKHVETKEKENKRPNLLRPVKKQNGSQRSACTMI